MGMGDIIISGGLHETFDDFFRIDFSIVSVRC